MPLTNNLGLPSVFYEAVKNDKYSKGHADYSISDLVNPPQLTLLKQRHAQEIVEDISDKIWSLLGKAVHYILEKGSQPHTVKEKRIHAIMAGRFISGQFDLYYTEGKLSDYKVTSAWSVVYGNIVKEWTERLNSYAYLLGTIGLTVTELEIVAMFRDWSASEAERYPDYPETEVQVIPIALWDNEAQEKFLVKRIELLKTNESLPDNQLTPCTSEEMWESPTKYAVKKHGRKSALRVFDTQDEADQFLDIQKGSGHFIETRPGARTRCEGKVIKGRIKKYCPVRDFCHQYQNYIKQKNQEKDT
ncbi:MAG: hypothetical protein QXI19_03050 [Candidatus Caldarchaeum sp.]